MPKKIIAVASAGGHWQQLQRMRRAFEGDDVLFLTTLHGLPDDFGALPAEIVPDCSQSAPLSALRCCLATFRIMRRHKPDVVVTTGALPGLIALAVGRLLGAKGVWVDSVANAEAMSSSGRMARHVAHLRLSQWEHVARASHAEYAGSIL